MSRGEHDRGMRAVERVRSVRERDSRLGLQQAAAEQARHQARLDDLERRLAESSRWSEGDTWTYLALRGSLLALGETIADAGATLEASSRITAAARSHWTQDKTRLSAVESLLERRVLARQAARRRAEARELDDIAAQLWSRGRGAAAAGATSEEAVAG
ncbi:flagellar FliJ family protein [Nocardioides houyundeii]|uniref:flagellar FliJ family protein n=1 Tax=Nocardioides houyundeii TaxID=2045452 RepID=UPI000DF15E04|nr:flagellar FliJ family protein [Nocardioides houyundeii]